MNFRSFNVIFGGGRVGLVYSIKKALKVCMTFQGFFHPSSF